MTFDSSTVCARTAAGETELTLPALGLSLSQRRVLTLLQSPSAIDEFAQRHHLEPAKLERDLARLADLRLVVVHGALGAAPPARAPVVEAMAPVVIGGTTRRAPVMAFAAGGAALLLAAGIWYGTRAGSPQNGPAPAAVIASSPAAAAISPPAAPTPRAENETAAFSGVAATATVLRGNAPPPDRRAEVRPALAMVATSAPAPARAPAPAAASSPASATAPAAAAPLPASVVASGPAAAPSPALAAPQVAGPGAIPIARPAVAPKADAVATANAAPAPMTTTAAVTPSAIPAVAAPAIAESPPPIQLAAANPAPTPRPTAPAPLKAISREPPEFPKEAIADGLKSGVVTARLHVDARGKVTGVDILGAQPSRVFDRAVRRALLQWQFEPPAAGAAADVDVDVKFQRD